MQIRGQLTPSELKEGASIFRSSSYRLRRTVLNWYALALIAMLIYGTIVAIHRFSRTDWYSLGIPWLIACSIVLISLYFGRSRVSRAFIRANRHLAGTFQISPDGVRFEAESGSNSFLPWGVFSGWKNGKLVYALKFMSGGITVLPLDGLSDDEIEKLNGILRSSIGEPR